MCGRAVKFPETESHLKLAPVHLPSLMPPTRYRSGNGDAAEADDEDAMLKPCQSLRGSGERMVAPVDGFRAYESERGSYRTYTGHRGDRGERGR
jgi:hypothetical protein